MLEALESLLAAALIQPLCISVSISAEARENLFYFELNETELSLHTASAIEAWLVAVVAGKQQQLQLLQGNGYAMQFYCWHDAQAAQLRFSLVSAAARLPFRCALRMVELPVIVQEFLAQEHLFFEEFFFDPDSATEQLATAETFVLSVWRTNIS